MKTNQVLIRKMGDFEIQQRTSDRMFNATALLKQWNQQAENRGKNLNTQNSGYLKKKDLDDFFNNKSTKEFIYVIKEKEDFKDGNSPYLKARGKYNGGTWMHPFLFIDFAMWLNAEFKYEVIKFVYDQLIQYRNEAGDLYKEMSSAIARITPKDLLPSAIPNVARAVNHIVYGQHESAIRNKQASEFSMKSLCEFQEKIISLINEGFINSYEELMNYLRKRWQEKWQPRFLNAA